VATITSPWNPRRSPERAESSISPYLEEYAKGVPNIAAGRAFYHQGGAYHAGPQRRSWFEAVIEVQFRIDEDFRTLFPKALIGIVVAGGIDNRRNMAPARMELTRAVAAALDAIGDADLTTHPAIAPWREAYRRFGLKPSRYRSSIENLLRAARAGGVRGINPLVDLYNAVSLRHLLPRGGEDLATVRGDLRLTVAKGDESFVPLGASEEQPPEVGEVVYADDLGIVCRAWNWREADRTKLTEATTRAILVIEALPLRTKPELRAACDDLAGLIGQHLGGTCRVELLGGRGLREVSLDA
jgi:DNA/RNA-binding domain of Phe-tRNA-synthetase-like protein